MVIHWSGPQGGLGNRIFGICSAITLARLAKADIAFDWHNNDECPADFNDLFQPITGVHIGKSRKDCDLQIESAPWNPIKIFFKFKNSLNIDTDEKEFILLFLKSLQELKYSNHINSAVETWIQHHKSTINIAIHVRRTDRIDHHKRSFKNLLRTQNLEASRYIIRATGIGKTLEYALLPKKIICHIEDRRIVNSVRQYLTQNPLATYTLYCDSQTDLEQLKEKFVRTEINTNRFKPSHSDSSTHDVWQKNTFRKTSMQDALIDLLCMSKSNAIVQNNPASTFSVLASIIGKSDIVSRQPTHDFWVLAKKLLVLPPNKL